jgi:adenylate cyclase
MDPEDPMLLYNLGCIHALAADPEEALDCLEHAVTNGLSQKNWFRHDGDLDSIRGLPRFQKLMASLED